MRNAKFENKKSKHLLQPYLQSGEKLRWTAQPSGWSVAIAKLPYLWFGFFWAGIVFYIVAPGFMDFRATEETVTFDPLKEPITIFALLFILIGLWVIASQLYTLLSSWFMHYGISTKRIVILRAIYPITFRSFFLSNLTVIERGGNDERGTIRILLRPSTDEEDNAAIELIGIAKPKQVEALIMNLIKPNTIASVPFTAHRSTKLD